MQNFTPLSNVWRNMSPYLSGWTRNFMGRKFLRRAIRLAKRAAYWEDAAFALDPELRGKLQQADKRSANDRLP